MITDTQLSDEALTELALAADPDTEVDDDAVSLWDLAADDALLPAWYMPTPGGGFSLRVQTPWKRRLILLVIVSFLLIDAAGLCSTYGLVTLA